jgi:hypothetical protein
MRSILLLLAFMATAEAQVSYLGLCNKTWNCQATVSSFGTGPIVTGWLENSFGSKCECANRLLQTANQKVIRVHLINSPCMRNKRCQRHDVLYGHTRASASRALANPRSPTFRRFEQVVARFKRRLSMSKGELQCYVSPCLECDLNGRARKTMLDAVHAALPSCVLVDNPHGQSCLPGYVCEGHGTSPNLSRPCIADNDGAEFKSLLDLKRYAHKTKDCDIRFYWSAWMNCNFGGFIPPTERICRTSFKQLNQARRTAWSLLYSQ